MRLIPPALVSEARAVYTLAGDQPAPFRMPEEQRLALAAWAQAAPAPGDGVSWLPLLATPAAAVPNGAISVDSADGIAKYKGADATLHPLY